MKKRRIIAGALVAVILLSCLMFSSCKKQKTKYSEYSLDYFDTVTTITGYEESREDFERVCGEVLAELGEYHRLFTIYHRFEGLENLCTVNELVGGEHRVVTVDRRIIDMLLYAKEMYQKTGGEVNVAMGSVLSVWHEYRTAGLDEPRAAELPPMERLREAAEHVDIDKLVIDEENSTVYISDPQMTLDVGAVAKGFAVEMAAQSLEAKGISGYVINVGGNVRTVGTKPDGESWLAGIENPVEDTEEAYVAYLELAGESVVTSGSYQRFYTVGDKNYHHIIDRETLMPAEGYLSVSVVCRSSAEADALSTALFCMPLDKGMALVESLDGVEALWITDGGERHFSSGFSSYVTER